MGNCGLNQGLGAWVPSGTGYSLKLTSPGLETQLYRELSAKRIRLEPRGTYPWPSEMARKRAQRGFTGSMPEFLSSQSQQHCLSATKSVKKQNSIE